MYFKRGDCLDLEKLKDVWEYYPTYSVDRSGKKVLIIHAYASLKNLGKFNIQSEEQIKKLWISALSNVSSLDKKALNDSLFEVRIEGGEVEVRVVIPQDYVK
ncbi:MAG: hypothetical protein QXN15_00520 [Candidatus Jordarchaeales archaeon]|nr:hypothetical protein [Candidatus Jordarchaeia archaeon]